MKLSGYSVWENLADKSGRVDDGDQWKGLEYGVLLHRIQYFVVAVYFWM